MGEPLAKEIAFWFSNFFLRKISLLLMHIIKPKMEPSFLHQNFLMILKTPTGVGELTYKYMKTYIYKLKIKKNLLLEPMVLDV